MCEVAILNPNKYSEEQLTDAAMDLYYSMPDSLGVVSILDHGDSFFYDIYKAMEPHRGELQEYFHKQKENNSIRVVIHARLATHGEENIQNAHPLRVDCPKCDVDYVIHNGIVRKERTDRRENKYEGHKYNTPVDSETIAHGYGEVPTEFGEGIYQTHSKEPAFVLFSKDSVLINTSARYVLDETGEFAMRRRNFSPNAEHNYDQVILTPTGGK